MKRLVGLRRRSVIAAALTAAVVLAAGACVPPTSNPPSSTTSSTTTSTSTVPLTPQQESLGATSEWLLTQFNSQGHLPHELDASTVDFGNQVIAVANLAALDAGGTTNAARLAHVEDNYEDYVDQGAGDRPGALARVILAAVAADADPRDFGGTDLVARLEATQRPNGLFGAQAPNFDGSFRQGLALAALSLAAPTSSAIAPGVSWLTDQQCDDGSWMMFRASLAIDCVENPTTGSFKDSNGTALAVLGLSAVGADADTDPSDWLTAVRGSDGGWGVSPSGPAQVSDANSTALVIAALESLGLVPDASAYDALIGFQLGSGAYSWKLPNQSPNRLATLDAMTALFDEVWPAALAGQL